MRALAFMMGLILAGILVLSSSKTNNYSHSQYSEEEGHDEMIGQEALKHL